jgi:hypothetical protein
MRMALTLAATALAVCGALATAATASAKGNAAATIDQWEANGYQVNIDRVGSGPLSACVVTSVRNPNTITQLVRIDRGGRGPDGRGSSVLVPVVVNRTVQVSLDCTG